MTDRGLIPLLAYRTVRPIPLLLPVTVCPRCKVHGLVFPLLSNDVPLSLFPITDSFGLVSRGVN